jgi:hypothetical protein
MDIPEVDPLHAFNFVGYSIGWSRFTRGIMQSACQSVVASERAELVDLSRDEARRDRALIPNAKVALPYLR